MNKNETYFELDSKEATHFDHCHLICYVYIKEHISICVNTHCLMLEVLRYIAYTALNAFNCVHTKIKAMLKVSKIHYRPHTDFNALNAMYVKDFKDGVCGFYATLHTELLNLLLMSKVSKMSNTMYSVYRGPLLLQEGRLFVI